MIKFIGIIMILISGTAMGFKASDNLYLQNQELKHLKKLIIILRGEINYNRSALSEALNNISGKTIKLYGIFLKQVAKRMEEYSGCTMKEIWNDEIQKNLYNSHLGMKYLNKLKELGDSLGFLDKEMQLASIDIYLEQLEIDIKENSEKLKSNSRLYKCLGIMGALFVTLIIS